MKIHPIYPFLFFIELALYGVILLVAYWLLWPYQTITFLNMPAAGAPIVGGPLYPGDAVRYKLSFCKYTNDIATVHRDLVDGETIALQDITGSLPSTCESNVTVATTEVPDTANPGVYHLDVADEFHPNPFRTIVVRYRTQDFTVIPRPEAATAIINGVPTPIIINASTTNPT
jgi:hypothetical protein